MVKFLNIIFLAILLKGCVPKIHVTVPSLEGNIIDSITKKPLTNVNISNSISTDEAGHFILPNKHELDIGTPMGGIWLISRLFTIEKEGYIPLSCLCEVPNSSGYCENILISLDPQVKNLKPTLIKVNSNVSCMYTLPKTLFYQ